MADWRNDNSFNVLTDMLDVLSVKISRAYIRELLNNPLGSGLRGISDALDARGMACGAYMKFSFITMFLFCFCAVSAAQEYVRLDSAILECTYNYREVDDTANLSDYKEDMVLLRIGKQASVSFNMKMFYSDSLCSTPGGVKMWGQMMMQSVRSRNYDAMPRPSTSLNEYVYKNYPCGKTTVTDIVGVSHIRYEEENLSQEWVVTDSLRQILGYMCQKAECDFRGRHYVAWFSTEIPVGDGPWKFGGLPGLILEVYDSNKYFCFTAVGIKQNCVQPVCFYDFHDYRKIKRDAFIKSRKNEGLILNTQAGNLGINVGGGRDDENRSPGSLEKY